MMSQNKHKLLSQTQLDEKFLERDFYLFIFGLIHLIVPFSLFQHLTPSYKLSMDIGETKRFTDNSNIKILHTRTLNLVHMNQKSIVKAG